MSVRFKFCLFGWWLLLAGSWSVLAFTTNDANTIFTAFNNTYLVGGYYPGWWTGAEEIEMAEDAYHNSPTAARRLIVSNACNQFIVHHGDNWTASGAFFNKFNDDICWAVLAFTRGYLITGNSNFLNIARSNWDAMYERAWETNFTGGGLWWNTDNNFKNAAVNGPAAIGACLLYQIFDDLTYLDKAQAIYAWERRVLFNAGNGAIADGINLGNVNPSGGATTYNQGTFIGAANLLYRITGLPFYYQDAVLAGKYTQNNMSSPAGIMPEYSSGTDLSGFNGIFARWMARFAKDQNLWPAFGPWLTTNANAAWNVRNAANLAWQKWATPMGTNAPNDWGCSASVVIMQVADATPPDALQISPSTGFTVAVQRDLLPGAASTSMTLTNVGTTPISWSLLNTCAWLNVSSSGGVLSAGGPSTSVTVGLQLSVITNLPAGRHYANIWFTNLATGAFQNRAFLVAVSAGDAPLELTGYNGNSLAPNTATAGVPGASSFDVPNNYCFYQTGLTGSTRGLPPDGVFTSLWDGTSVFQFRYGSTNALILGYTYPGTATLTLVSPKAYNSISFLGCSANGGGTGTFVLNFTNGTHSPSFSFNAQDWFGTTNNVGIKGFGRLKLGSGFGAEENGANNPNLYQTTVKLAQLGLNQPIASITFTKPAGANAQQTTGIFAVSGSVMPDQPLIIQQPQSLTNNLPGLGATFNVLASGALPLSYQWQFSASGNPGTFTPLNNQTNASLSLSPPLQLSDAGSYQIVVTNSYGAATSSIATLTVYRTPIIVQQPTPTNTQVFVGVDKSWSLIANAALPVDYFWRRNETNIPGATSPSLQLLNLQTSDTANYTAVISNAFGAVTSSVVSLRVVPLPTYPVGQLVLADNPIGYWRLDELGGNVAHDLLFGNNGTFTSTVLLGQPGNKLIDTHPAARFGLLANNTSCVTNINLDFATSGNASFSAEAWVYGGAQTTDAGIITKGYGSGGEQFNLDCGGINRGFRFFVRDGGGSAKVASSSIVPGNQWRHLVGVCDQSNGQVHLYVDGSIAASGSIGPNTGILSSSHAVSIGSRQSGNGTPFDFQFVGFIEEVAVYSYALNATQVQSRFLAASNRAPAFVSNPFTTASVNAGQGYSGTLHTYASDPNGDPMTFTKLGGPSWLNIAANGSMNGLPFSTDVGTNAFVVRVSDPGGLLQAATMDVPVIAAPPIIMFATQQGTNLALSWTGGIAPYQLQERQDLEVSTWHDLGANSSSSNLLVPLTNQTGFYRVLGQ